MATLNIFQPLTQAIGAGVHDFANDQLVVALTNVAPTAGLATLSQITEISYTNLSSRNLTTTSFTQTAGVASLALEDLTLTASGAVPEFRYVVIYNDDATNDELVGWYDREEGIELENDDTFTFVFSDSNVLFDISIGS